MITITKGQRLEIVELVISLGTVESEYDLYDVSGDMVDAAVQTEEVKSYEDLIDAAYIMAEMNDEALKALQS